MVSTEEETEAHGKRWVVQGHTAVWGPSQGAGPDHPSLVPGPPAPRGSSLCLSDSRRRDRPHRVVNVRERLPGLFVNGAFC